MDKNDLQIIQNHVGKITEDDLRYVEYFVSDKLSLYIPSIGQCQYAIMPKHSHPAYSFILNFTSSSPLVKIDIDCDNDSFIFSSMAPGVPHEEERTDSFTRYIAIMIDEDFFMDIYSQYTSKLPKKYDWYYFTVKKDILFFMKSFMAEFEQKSPGYENVLNNLSNLICNYIIRSILNIKSKISNVSNRIEIAKIVEYMHENFGNKLTVENMASFVNMSQSHFTRIFKKEMGKSPVDYLIGIRIDKAKQFLRNTNNSMTDIAYDCGFNSPSHFSSSFSNFTGLNPKDYKSNLTK